MHTSLFEILMLISFASSWPFSIIKALRTKVVLGKSPLFMGIIIFGYVMGILHKVINMPGDPVVWLYLFNLLIVSTDLVIYFCYIGKNREELMKNQKQNL
ncbi:MAG: hypothetical protein MJZ76_02025 [Bacteroidales bacterium]|nr:hypothetical protein [Bacteroidales bacterium]